MTTEDDFTLDLGLAYEDIPRDNLKSITVLKQRNPDHTALGNLTCGLHPIFALEYLRTIVEENNATTI